MIEQSHLPAKQTLDRLGIPRSTFYLWYDKYQTGGVDGEPNKNIPSSIGAGGKPGSSPGTNTPAATGSPAPNGEEDPEDEDGDKDGQSKKGTKTDPRTLFQTKGTKNNARGNFRIDVENQQPGQRPGSLHVQFGGRGSTRFEFNRSTGQFDGLSSRENARILNTPGLEMPSGKA